MYIAGPMRGYKEYNFPAFHRAALMLRKLGWEVLSPAEIDNDEGFCEKSTPQENLTKEHLVEFILRDVKIVTEVDALCMLPGSEGSRGAQVELAMARYMQIAIYYIDDDWNLRQSTTGQGGIQ